MRPYIATSAYPSPRLTTALRFHTCVQQVNISYTHQTAPHVTGQTASTFAMTTDVFFFASKSATLQRPLTELPSTHTSLGRALIPGERSQPGSVHLRLTNGLLETLSHGPNQTIYVHLLPLTASESHRILSAVGGCDNVKSAYPGRHLSPQAGFQ